MYEELAKCPKEGWKKNTNKQNKQGAVLERAERSWSLDSPAEWSVQWGAQQTTEREEKNHEQHNNEQTKHFLKKQNNKTKRRAKRHTS